MKKKIIYISEVLILISLISASLFAQEWQSRIVFYNSNNNLEYVADYEGNKIPDFSHAGYRNGNESIPNIPIVKTISPIEGDNTELINSAILEVSQTYSFDKNGFKGAILLEAGEYEVFGTINIKFEGVVLKGVGHGIIKESNTIIVAKGNSPEQRSVVVLGGGKLTAWKNEVANSRSFIISDSIKVGEYSFEVDNPNLYNIGDNIIIYHPCTQEWLEAIDLGGTHSDDSNAEQGVDVPWQINSHPIVFNRNIKNIEGNVITIDVPVYNSLIKKLSQSYIYKFNSAELIRNVGVENLRVEIETSTDPEDINHAWNAFDFYQVEDAWTMNCTAAHFGLSGFRTGTASRITIENCSAIDPISKLDGGSRYNFNANTASQQILFKDCFANNGRHHYVSNGMSWNSGIVFYNCESSGAYTSSEGHRQWSMGILWDNHVELDGPRTGSNPRLLGLYNRGNYGTSHGWAIAHSVAWNCNVNNGDIIVQKPPTAQNYVIGSFGNRISGNGPFEEPIGYIEGTNKSGLNPQSLYVAQLEERLNLTDVKNVATNKNLIDSFELKQNYPNPFNNSTKIEFSISEPGNYKIIVYNSLGQTIEKLFNGYLKAGNYSRLFNANDISSGIYFYSIQSKNNKIIKKMIYLS
jgi:hypothetical protein